MKRRVREQDGGKRGKYKEWWRERKRWKEKKKIEAKKSLKWELIGRKDEAGEKEGTWGEMVKQVYRRERERKKWRKMCVNVNVRCKPHSKSGWQWWRALVFEVVDANRLGPDDWKHFVCHEIELNITRCPLWVQSDSFKQAISSETRANWRTTAC